MVIQVHVTYIHSDDCLKNATFSFMLMKRQQSQNAV